MLGKTLTEAIHETAKDLHKAGVMSEQAMREFDAMCLPPVKRYKPVQIKPVRKRNYTQAK
jgi:putative transcriptional regulator